MSEGKQLVTASTYNFITPWIGSLSPMKRVTVACLGGLGVGAAVVGVSLFFSNLPVASAKPPEKAEGATAKTSNPTQPAEPVEKNPQEKLFDKITAQAKALAGKAYEAPQSTVPQGLAEMNYAQYKSIDFKPEAAVWKDKSLYEMQMFHPGFLYKDTVAIRTFNSEGVVSEVQFDTNYFDYQNKTKRLAADAPANMGFSGFRLHYPVNREDHKDEIITFQGASYFRIVGPGQIYGLSARGLAIDTAMANGEEFPSFRAFWVEEPKPDQTVVTIFALLDSPSISGAYKFTLQGGAPTSMRVDARLFAREDIAKLGVAPLTSMFFHGENQTMRVDSARPEAHDSDGLQIQTANDEWIWRPLVNPKSLRITSSMSPSIRGFGLVQRDRDFDHYQDLEFIYERRPSLWVEPIGDWGNGRVELVEIPTDTETNDNMVAYWVPQQSMKAGDIRHYSYKLLNFDATLPWQLGMAQVLRTSQGWAAVTGQPDTPEMPATRRKFFVDFKGGQLPNLGAGLAVKPELQVNGASVMDVKVNKLPKGDVWRVSFELTPESDNNVDMRLFLSLRGQRLSEVWNYVWSPNAVQ